MQIHLLYSIEESRLLIPWQIIRQRILYPVIKILIFLKITPNKLSYTAVVFGIFFCFLANKNFSIAFWFLVLSIICDGLDGVLARATGRDSSQGAFTDAICDQSVLALSVIGMIIKGTLYPSLGVLLVYLYTTFMMFIILHNVLEVSSEFIIRPSRNLFFICISIYYFLGINLLNFFALASFLTIPLLLISFKRLRSTL